MKATSNLDLIDSSYSSSFLCTPKLLKLTTKAAKFLKTKNFDTIAFRGMSGAMVAPLLATKTDKNLMMVRKPKSDCHSKKIVEGYRRVKTYIIVDDFVDSGLTFVEIYYAIQSYAPSAKCLGILSVSENFGDDDPIFKSLSYMKNNYEQAFKRYHKARELKKSKAKAKLVKKKRYNK